MGAGAGGSNPLKTTCRASHVVHVVPANAPGDTYKMFLVACLRVMLGVRKGFPIEHDGRLRLPVTVPTTIYTCPDG